jgi:hypothetical protein
MEYTTFGPDAEVYGAAMLAFIQSINYGNFHAIMEDHGVKEVNPQKWYPQQLWLDIFTDIGSRPGGSSDFVSIGMKIAETAVVPSEVEDIPFVDLMQAFDAASYRANNRGEDIGGIETEVVSDNHIIMIDRTPYPDDFVYGAYYGMAKRFLPKGTMFTVAYDEDTPRRDKGGDATLVHIKW